jgi:pyruvate/2-oxoglutarate dehydrogenase complex dihydrolipoamide acyltransferase (E2) component
MLYLTETKVKGVDLFRLLPKSRSLWSMRVSRILALPSCNNVVRAIGRNRLVRVAVCMSVLLLNAVFASPLAAQANDAVQATPATPAAPATPAQPAHPAHRRPNLDDRVKALATALALNDAQQAAVKKILEQRQMEILRLRRDGSIPGSVRIERLRALQDQTVQRIRLVLNDEQKKKYDPLAVRQTGPAQGQKSVEDWLKVTTPQ